MLRFRMTKRKGLIISLIVWIAASLMLLYLFFVPVDEEYPCETESHPTTIEMIIYSFINQISIAYWIFICLYTCPDAFGFGYFPKKNADKIKRGHEPLKKSIFVGTDASVV